MMMGLILVRDGLHDDIHMERVLPVVLALCRSRRPERAPWRALQPSEVGDVVNRPQPFDRATGKVRHWESPKR